MPIPDGYTVVPNWANFQHMAALLGSYSSGNKFYVSSVTGSDTYDGLAQETPLATLQAAVNKCTVNNGDLIIILPGHAETYSTTGTKVTLNIAGITVIGLGNGPNRPTFTFSHTGAAWVWSANGIKIQNLLFVAGVDSVTAPLTISGTDWAILNCEWRDTTDVEFVRALITTDTADRGLIDGMLYNGYTGGNACVNAIRLIGVDSCTIRNCKFKGLASTAWIEFITTACTKIDIHNCLFQNTGTALIKNIVNTGGVASTWMAHDCYDLIGGYGVSGGSGSALAADDTSAIASALATLDGIAGAIRAVTDLIPDLGALSTIDTNIDDIEGAIGTLVNAGGTASIGAILGNMANISIATRLTNILAAVGKTGAFAWGVVDAAVDSTTVIPSLGLAGYGDDFFNTRYYMQILHNENNAGVAPENETRQITDYVSATGTFTCTAFSQNVQAGDIILILHQSAAAATNVEMTLGAAVGASISADIAAIKAVDDAVSADLGDPTARTNLKTFLTLLGNPDAANQSIWNALAVAGGIATYPAAAIPGNGAALAQVLRDIWDAVRNGTGGTEPGANRSIVDETRGSALNHNAVNYLAVTVDLSDATWKTVDTHELFTVTGLVRMRIAVEVTETGNDTSGDTATIQLGVEGATDAFIAATQVDDLTIGELWYDATPTVKYDNFSSVILDKVVNGLDVGYEILVEASTDGTLVFHLWWEPLNAAGAVVAGDGSAL